MKKIGIITLNGNFNYGNRLQNYALETAIKKFGYTPETVILPNRKFLKTKIKEIKSSLRLKLKTKNWLRLKMVKEKTKIFTPYSEKYLNNVKHSRREKFSTFDKFIVGSDQVWNPSWKLIDDHWLRFVPKYKRFSYAASMATTKCKPKNKEKLVKYLQGMREISVREAESVPFIKDISGRNAKLVVDPTMLLTKEEYLSFINKEKKNSSVVNEEFILIYALTGLSKSIQEKISFLVKKYNYRIIEVMGKRYDEKALAYNWIEFVQAVNQAKFVISDSFHCGVFSIIMNTPFILFDRADGLEMQSRLNTLLSTFGFEKCMYNEETNLEDILEMYFDKSNKILSSKRKEGLDYLESILKM